MKKYLIGAVAAASLSLGGAAHATTYLLTDDHCTGTCGLGAGQSYGTLTVTGSGTTQIDFSLDLTSGIKFNANGNGLDTFSWDLLNNPAIAITGLSAGFSGTSPQNAANNHEDGFGSFDYIINVDQSGLSHLQFTVKGSGANLGSLLTLDHNTADSQSIFAAVDVVGANGKTGVIGATLDLTPTTNSGAPEPASWALMILGFGGVGSVLRSRRRLATAAI